MRAIARGVIIVVACVLGLSTASARMVVDRNTGERVDHPFHGPGHAGFRYRHRYYAFRQGRIVVIQAGFPTPEPFGWLTCCN